MSAKIITIFNQKGGVGKTTVAANLAYETELSGKRTLLIDLDPQASLGIWVSNSPDEEPFPAAYIDLSKMKTKVSSELKKHAGNYDVIIIDCPPTNESKEAQTALMVSDIVLIPIEPSPLSLMASDEALAFIQNVKIYNETLVTLIMASKVETKTKLAKSIMEELKNTEDAILIDAYTSVLDGYRQASLYGTGVSSLKGHAKAVTETKLFAREVLSYLG